VEANFLELELEVFARDSTVVVESVEPLECIANEWQAQLRGVIPRLITGFLRESLEKSCVVRLVDFVRRKVGCVNVGCKFRLERCSDSA